MTETIFGENVYNMYFDLYIGLCPICLHSGGGVYDLHYSQSLGAIDMFWLHFWRAFMLSVFKKQSGCEINTHQVANAADFLLGK